MIVTYAILAPTVELAYERFDAEWPCVWLVYGDAGVGWKDPKLSRVYLRIDGYRFLAGDDRFREYQVRAVKRETAIDRAVELLRSTVPLEVTIYHVQLPLTAAEIGQIAAFNARLQRDPRWGAGLRGRK